MLSYNQGNVYWTETPLTKVSIDVLHCESSSAYANSISTSFQLMIYANISEYHWLQIFLIAMVQEIFKLQSSLKLRLAKNGGSIPENLNFIYEHYFCTQGSIIYVILHAIWCYLFNFKNAKNTHEGVLLLAKLKATNGTKSRKASQSLKSTKYISDLIIKSQM